jgi:hypothetical protein
MTARVQQLTSQTTIGAAEQSFDAWVAAGP